MEAFDNLDRIHRGASDFYRHARSALAVSAELKQANGAAFLTERRTAHVENVVQSFQINRSIDTQIRSCAFRKFSSKFDVDGHSSVLHAGIDAHDRARNYSVMRVDRSGFADLYIARLCLGDLDSGH